MRIKRFLLVTVIANAAMAADQAPAVHTIPSPVERAVVVRLKNKTDILDGLKEAIAYFKGLFASQSDA